MNFDNVDAYCQKQKGKKTRQWAPYHLNMLATNYN